MVLNARDWVKSFTKAAAVLALASSVTTTAYLTGKAADPQVTLMLESPSFIDHWEEAASKDVLQEPRYTDAPLVRQANKLAQLLDPSGPRAFAHGSTNANRPAKAGRPRPPEVRPSQTNPKFTLIATSCYPADPSQSMALILEAGQKTRWIKPGQQLGYLVVEEVLAGTLVCRDGASKVTVAIDRDENRAPGVIVSDPMRPGSHWTRVANSATSQAVGNIELQKTARARTRPRMYRLGPVR